MELRGAHLRSTKAGGASLVQGFYLGILCWCWAAGAVSAYGAGMGAFRHTPPKSALPFPLRHARSRSNGRGPEAWVFREGWRIFNREWARMGRNFHEWEGEGNGWGVLAATRRNGIAQGHALGMGRFLASPEGAESRVLRPFRAGKVF